MDHIDRVGLTVPLPGLALRDHVDAIGSLMDAGLREVWTGEVDEYDAFTPLAMLAGAHPGLGVNAAVASVFTRGPALLASQAAALADVAPGRARFGIGAASPPIVAWWNGIAYERPYTRVRDTLRFLREVLDTGRAKATGEAVGSTSFRLRRVPHVPPELVVAALGPRMQRLAAAEADGVALNFLTADDLATVIDATDGVDRQVASPLRRYVRVFVCPGPGEEVELGARRHLAGYLTVPGYWRFQEWLGRRDALQPMRDAWDGGDRRRAVAEIPDDVVEGMVITGDPARCADGIRAYLEQGADEVTIGLVPPHGPAPSPDRLLRDVNAILAELGGESQPAC